MANNLHYDDRLATAISGAVPEASLAAVQYRQIVDLLADAKPADSEYDAALMRFENKGRYYSQVDLTAALVRLNALAQKMAPEKQAEALSESNRPLQSPPLVRFLLEQPKQVRDAAVAKTRLPAEKWLEIIKTLSSDQRAELMHKAGLMDQSGDKSGAASAVQDDTDIITNDYDADKEIEKVETAESVAGDPPASDIGEIVERIAHFTAQRASNNAPHLPLEGFAEDQVQAIKEICFVSDKSGQLVTADPDCEGFADGMPIFLQAMAGSCGCDPETARLANQYRPIVNGRYVHRGSPLLAGAWRLDAWPRFASGYDREFIGYCGVLMRLVSDEANDAESTIKASAVTNDDYRQLAHELKTPAGALKGFAEILETQLFGPVAKPYRNMAHNIIQDTDTVLDQLATLPLSEREDA
ncbi:MAG: hypothetical protein AAGH53_01795 [Pseudomonadota bacterium]